MIQMGPLDMRFQKFYNVAILKGASVELRYEVSKMWYEISCYGEPFFNLKLASIKNLWCFKVVQLIGGGRFISVKENIKWRFISEVLLPRGSLLLDWCY